MTLFKTLCLGGPVAVAHVLRQAHLARRMKRVCLYIEREKELHRAHLKQLNHELLTLSIEQHNAEVQAARYWSALS